jgi:hypothetical protein
MKQVVDTQKAIDALLAEHPALKNNGANFRLPFGGREAVSGRAACAVYARLP